MCAIAKVNTAHRLIGAFVGVGLLAGGIAFAQTGKDPYPDRPVRLIVPFAAGGPSDIFARLIGQKLSAKTLSQAGEKLVSINVQTHGRITYVAQTHSNRADGSPDDLVGLSRQQRL
jgi:hypothetical protein